MALSQFARGGTSWYVSDGLIWDNSAVALRRQPGRPLPCSSKLLVFNPCSRAARATTRFYHTDRPPTSVSFAVAPGRVETVDLSRLNEIPHNQSFWIVIESSVPVMPQARHEDYTFWEATPDALVAVAPYPGPLEEETSWVFPDCYESDPTGPWYELETLTLLNPNKRSVSARIRYLLRSSEVGGEEEIEIAGERVAQLNVWERQPRPIGQPQGPPLHIIGDYAVRIDATAPVIAQTTRRARWSGYPSVIGARSTMGFPLRDRGPTVGRRRAGTRGAGAPKAHLTWHYPGGAIIDRGILPRAMPSDHPLNQCDNAWNLVFINNLDEARSARATITFHRPDGSQATSDPIAIPPLRSTLQWLHAEPWLGRCTRVGEPFALTVTADRPIVAEVCGAEFEMWSQVMPGAMSAVNLYPGPLKGERTWWLGIAPTGGSDDRPVEWQHSYHLFNPGRSRVNVTLSFLGLRRHRTPTHHVAVGPGAVTVVQSSEVKGLPVHEPVCVRADGDRPFCAQVFVRAFTRGLPHVRAMCSSMGIPIALEP